MLVPVLPLYLADTGLSATSIGIVIAAAGAGGMLSQIALGQALTHRSETSVMVASVALMAATTALLGAVGGAVALATLRLFGGVGSAGWLLSRQTFLTRTVGIGVRGRAMAVFGGTTRVAFLIGPLLGGYIADQYGFRFAFTAIAAIGLTGALPVLIWQKRAADSSGPAERRVNKSERPSLRPHRRALLTAGFGQVLVVAVRQGRFVVLPLIGLSIGLSASEVGVLIGIGSLADLVLFPASGYIMDRFGRLMAICPALILMGVGLLLLAVADTRLAVTIAAAVIGVGNGLGSGTMLTLSADLAPLQSPSNFLAALGTIRDAGRIAGPFLVGWSADRAGLSWSAAMLAVLAFVAVVVFIVGVGETRQITPTPA